MENYLIDWALTEDETFDANWFFEWLNDAEEGTDYMTQDDGYLLLAGHYPDDDQNDIPDFVGHAGGGNMNESHDIISG